MKLGTARFLTDENIRQEVVAFLRARSLDVKDVQEEGLFGASDRRLLQLGLAEERVVLTHDSDFGALVIAAQESAFGIVYLRPGHLSPDFTIETLRAVFDLDLEVEPPFILVAKRGGEEVRIRLRRLA